MSELDCFFTKRDFAADPARSTLIRRNGWSFSMRANGSTDSGFATVWVAIALVVMLVFMAGALQLGSAVLARQRVENTADLAALAGAAEALSGRAAVCDKVVAVTRASDVELIGCEMQGLDVLVRVSVRAGPFGGVANGRARAGPVR